jgi:hypothetical protein
MPQRDPSTFLALFRSVLVDLLVLVALVAVCAAGIAAYLQATGGVVR